MFDIIIENKKLFSILFVIAVIIIIVIVWLPEKDLEISHYEELSEEIIDNRVAKQYGDELQFALYTQNLDFMREKILKSYTEYNNIPINDYNNWLVSNNLFTTNVSLGETTKYKYGNKSIYSINAFLNGKTKVINIIESYPEDWNLTFDTFIDYHSDIVEKNYNEYGAIINSIYQDINYIQFDVSVYTNTNESNVIDISKSDSVKLIMKDNTSFIMATNNYTSESIIVNNKEYTTIKCIFNIPISNQNNIKSIVFNTFNINNREERVTIDLSL